MQKVGEHPWGLLVDERNLVTDGFKKAVVADVQWSASSPAVEQKKKLKGKEQLGSLVREWVTKVEGELQTRIREIQTVTEAGVIGKELSQPTVAKDGEESDRNQGAV